MTELKEKIQKTLRDSVLMRWLALLMVSGLMFATYWFQDFFSGLKPLMESQLGISSTQFGTLISLTTIANVFGMIIIGGIILDKWGIRRSMLIFGSVATLGGAVVAIGASGIITTEPSKRLLIMIIGRILFGIGLEITAVIITKTIVKWFKGHELALAMAINIGFGRLGSALGTSLSPEIAHDNVPVAVTFAATLIGIGFFLFIIYMFFDVKLDKQLNETVSEDEKFKFSDLKKLVTDKSFILISLLCVAFYSAVFPFMQYAPDLLVNKFGFTYDLPANASQIVIFGSATLGNTLIYVVLFLFGVLFPVLPSKLKTKSSKILSIIILSFLFIGFIYLIRDTLSIWIKNGPKVASLIPMATIMFSPIFGNFVDKKGKAASLMILGSLLLIFAHLSLSIFNNVFLGYFGLISLGMAFSLVPAAMWPSVAKIVPEYRIGTAYATMFTVQNWGLLAFYAGIGKVLDLVNPSVIAKIRAIRNSLAAQGLSEVQISEKIQAMKKAGQLPIYNYTIPILLLVILGVISIFLAFMLKKSDKEQGYGLELPS